MKQTVLAGAALAVLLAACAGGPLQPPGPGGTTTLPPGGIYKGTATAHGSAMPRPSRRTLTTCMAW